MKKFDYKAKIWGLVIVLALLSQPSVQAVDCIPADTGPTNSSIGNLGKTVASLQQATDDNAQVKAMSLLAARGTAACQIKIDVSSFPCSTNADDEDFFSDKVRRGEKASRVLTQEDVNNSALDAMGFNASDLATYKKMFGKSPLVTFYSSPEDLTGYQTLIMQCEKAQHDYVITPRGETDTFVYPISGQTCRQVKAFSAARHELRDKSQAIAFGTEGQNGSTVDKIPTSYADEQKSPEDQYKILMAKMGLDPDTLKALSTDLTPAEAAEFKKEGIDPSTFHNLIKSFHDSFVSAPRDASFNGETDQGQVIKVKVPLTSDGRSLLTVLSDLATKRIDAAADAALQAKWAKSKYPAIDKYFDLCVKDVANDGGKGLEDTKLKFESLYASIGQFGADEDFKEVASASFQAHLLEAQRELADHGQIVKSGRCSSIAHFTRSATDMGSKIVSGFLLGMISPTAGIVGGSTLFAADSAGEAAENGYIAGQNSTSIGIKVLTQLFINQDLYTGVGVGGEVVLGGVGLAGGGVAEESANFINAAAEKAVTQKVKTEMAEALSSCGQMVFISVASQVMTEHPQASADDTIKLIGQSCASGIAFHVASKGASVAVSKVGVPMLDAARGNITAKDMDVPTEGQTLDTNRGTMKITKVDPSKNLLVAEPTTGDKTPVQYNLSEVQKQRAAFENNKAQTNVQLAKLRMKSGTISTGDLVSDKSGKTYTVTGISEDAKGKFVYAVDANGNKVKLRSTQLAAAKRSIIYGQNDLKLKQSTDTGLSTPERAKTDIVFATVRTRMISKLNALMKARVANTKFAANDDLLIQHVVDNLNPEEVTALDAMERNHPEEFKDKVNNAFVGCNVGAKAAAADNEWDPSGAFRGILYAQNEAACIYY